MTAWLVRDQQHGLIQSTVRGEDWRGLIFPHDIWHSSFQALDIFFALQVMIYSSGFSNACRSLKKVSRSVKMEAFSSCKTSRSL